MDRKQSELERRIAKLENTLSKLKEKVSNHIAKEDLFFKSEVKTKQ